MTIGDGLVTQVPAFLISLAAGLLVTRSSNETDLPAEFLKQLFSRPQALAVAAGFLGILIFTSLPRLPLLALGGGCLALATATRAATQARPRPRPSNKPRPPSRPNNASRITWPSIPWRSRSAWA